jgi:RNA polymerase sigma factor (TIGR02999 family)
VRLALLIVPRTAHNRDVDPRADVTDLLHRAQEGDAEAAAALLDATYVDLRRMARARLRAGGREVLLDTSSLVSEWYLRFTGGRTLLLQDRVHFMRHASRVMRSVIVDFARRRSAHRRGGKAAQLGLSTPSSVEADRGPRQILRVHEALAELDRHDSRMAQVVEMRYFAGLTETEIAACLGVTDRTVRRDWDRARLWLRNLLK